MNNLFREASEAGDIPCEGKQDKHWRKIRLTDEGLTTPGTVFTSPWMDSNRSPDTCFVNTVTQTALPGVNANKHPDTDFVTALTKAMSPTDKIDSWFASAPAGPSQSSISRPNTRDTASSSFAGGQSQLFNHNTGATRFDPIATGLKTRDFFLDSFVDDQSKLPTAQVDTSTRVPDSVTADKSKPSTSRLGMRDTFFDSVPKGPSQLSVSRWNARDPVFNPWTSTQDQTPTSPWNKAEASVSQVEKVEENPRPRLTLRIPNTSIGSDNFRSASQMATHSDIPDPRADAPHTTDSLVPAVRLSNTGFQSPQRQAPQRGDILNPAGRPFRSKFSGPRGPAHRNNNVMMQPSATSHTNSRTWTNKIVVEKERWQRVEDSLGRMNLLRSSVVPKTLKDWLAHQRGRTDAKREREQRKLDDMNRSLRDPRLPSAGRPVKIGPAFRGRAFEHKNYCSVLVFPSVWARMYEPPAERLDPLWPCTEEMKEEGDERNTSGFRRFPALPRVPGNDTVQYKLKAIQPFLPFDAIWELPTKQSVEATNKKPSPEETGKMEAYLGRSLLDALDCITEDSF